MSSNKSRFRSNDGRTDFDIEMTGRFSILDKDYLICAHGRVEKKRRMSESENGFGGGMDLDPAFTAIPKNKSCLFVWRVEVR